MISISKLKDLLDVRYRMFGFVNLQSCDMSPVQLSFRLRNIIPRPRLKSSGCFGSIFYGREKDIESLHFTFYM